MLTQRQIEIVNGSLLGDGTIWTNFKDKNNEKFQTTQSRLDHKGVDKNSYIYWYAKEFINFGCSVKPKKNKVKGLVNGVYDQYVFYTKCDKIWKELEKKWYIPYEHKWYKRKKIVSNDLKLTPVTACVWMMDDGSNNAKDGNIELNTQGFSKEEVEFLCNLLQTDLGIKSHPKKAKKSHQFKIYIGRESYFDFIDLIKPCVQWECFKYKIDTSNYKKTSNVGETHPSAKLNEEQIREIFRLKEKGIMQKDIAIKLHVSPECITRIINGTLWSHIEGLKRGTDKKKTKRLTKKQKNEIKTLYSEGQLQKEIASKFNVKQSTISRCLKN